MNLEQLLELIVVVVVVVVLCSPHENPGFTISSIGAHNIQCYFKSLNKHTYIHIYVR